MQQPVSWLSRGGPQEDVTNSPLTLPWDPGNQKL